MIAILLFSGIAIVFTAPVRTSMCCCGCTEEPCPVVGPSCPAPQFPCEIDSGMVMCEELQRLWDLSLIHRPRTTFGRIGAPGSLEESYAENPPFNVSSFEKNGIVNSTTLHSEIRFTPIAHNAQKNVGFNRRQKLDRLIEQLEILIVDMKKILREEARFEERHPAPPKPLFIEPPTLSTTNDFTEDEEKAVIDDVIKKLKQTIEIRRSQEAVSLPSVPIDGRTSASQLTRVRISRAAGKSGNCNDEELRTIITENISETARASKRAIQKAAEKQLGGSFNVICSPCEFSFVISSRKYCEGFKDQVACFVFLQPTAGITTIKE